MCKCYTDTHPVSSRARERQKHREKVSVDALVFALQLMAKEQPGPQKAQHSPARTVSMSRSGVYTI